MNKLQLESSARQLCCAEPSEVIPISVVMACTVLVLNVTYSTADVTAIDRNLEYILNEETM